MLLLLSVLLEVLVAVMVMAIFVDFMVYQIYYCYCYYYYCYYYCYYIYYLFKKQAFFCLKSEKLLLRILRVNALSHHPRSTISKQQIMPFSTPHLSPLSLKVV